MDLRDVRRFAVTVLGGAAVLLAWLLVLALADAGTLHWGWAQESLQRLPIHGWLWIGVLLMVLALVVLAVGLYGVDETPPGLAHGTLRQVQCQDCRAVFMIRDTGHRPLTHACPGCRAYGVYDGTAPPVGKPPEARPPRQLVRLDMDCRSCRCRFSVTDTGHRPLKVSCPECGSLGRFM